AGARPQQAAAGGAGLRAGGRQGACTQTTCQASCRHAGDGRRRHPLKETRMDKRRVLSLIKTAFTGFDKPLALIVFLLFATGIVALYSAAIDMPGKVEDQLRNILLSYVVMLVIAYLPTQTLMRVAVPIYSVGVALLIAVAMFGLIRKGAR